MESSRAVGVVVVSSGTKLCDDVVDVTSLSALDVLEIKSLMSSSLSAPDVVETPLRALLLVLGLELVLVFVPLKSSSSSWSSSPS